MYTLGKFLQAIGLIVPLIGLTKAIQAGGGANTRGVAMTELTLLGVGALLFILGTKILQNVEG